jgi:hypothetical protein
MALNCESCTSKNAASDVEYCKCFSVMPQLDLCHMHSDSVAARDAKVAETPPSYLWLVEARDKEENLGNTQIPKRQ